MAGEAQEHPNRKKPGLQMVFAGVIMAVTLVTVAVFAVASHTRQLDAGQQKALAEARLLAKEMDASWNYIDAMQDIINTDSDGSYNFKGVYCSVAGKSIARRFTKTTDCTIRYVRDDPRTPTDAPDAFESRALAAFAQGQSEYYGVDEVDGQKVFRFLSALELKYNCLVCHGEPAGTPDDTGFMREGMKLGDLAGAVSISIPMDSFVAQSDADTLSYVLLFAALAGTISVAIALVFNRVISRPLRRLSGAAAKVGAGNFDAGISDARAYGEIAELSEEFEQMRLRLKESYETLERRVEERTVELARANERLQREVEYKTTFLNTMTHELRTPLVSIGAYADVWMRTAGGKDPEQDELIEGIRESEKALLATINNTLDAASIEAGRFMVNMTPTDLLDVASEIEAIAAPLAQVGEIGFEVRAPGDLPVVRTDAAVLHKILVNLVGNAIKFTGQGGKVVLELGYDAGRLQIRVTDTGIGIPPEDLDVIFERFKQADQSISRRYGGSGLGLSLVKDMTALLGGGIHVESVVGQGSTFTVWLPCDEVKGE